jgi:hypothetical protein
MYPACKRYKDALGRTSHQQKVAGRKRRCVPMGLSGHCWTLEFLYMQGVFAAGRSIVGSPHLLLVLGIPLPSPHAEPTAYPIARLHGRLGRDRRLRDVDAADAKPARVRFDPATPTRSASSWDLVTKTNTKTNTDTNNHICSDALHFHHPKDPGSSRLLTVQWQAWYRARRTCALPPQPR